MFSFPATARSKVDRSIRRMQSAAVFLRETPRSPLSMVTSQRSTRLPSAISKRALPFAFSSSGSCPRRPSSAKNSAIVSDVGFCFLATTRPT
jgi:hypothetical protein